ncbi:MAG: ATP-dependent sacrificial sulfur transferase LarE [bacterium]|nr:ATP-dependent sacrificial sulfur transferase LarE [bacterium]
MKTLTQKQDMLRAKLLELGSVAVAFSAGVDSTFLLAMAHEVLGDRALALTIRSAFVTESEIDDAITFTKQRNIPFRIIDIDVLGVEAIRNNPPDRCYICKRELFGTMLEAAAEAGHPVLLEGSNVDDLGDYRPGRRAVKELGVHSPLLECGLTKQEIRTLSRDMDLPTWEKPALACLASRIPYGREIDDEVLSRIAQAEKLLRDLGFIQLRVRDHGDVARVELAPEEIEVIVSSEIRSRIVTLLKKVGYPFVCLDLEGYRTGALNETLNETEIQ